MERVVARACANIGLCKYWGKRGPGNAPATPSIGLALAQLVTETAVTRIRGRNDRVVLNGRTAEQATRRRVTAYLATWRRLGLLAGHFRVESTNRFPTAAGLASSSAGYAALAMALGQLATRQLSAARLSRLARLGSGSAARSVLGGISAMGTGVDPASLLLAPAEDVPWGMVLAIVDYGAKTVDSRLGMELSRVTSPFYSTWVRVAPKHYRRMTAALKKWDLAGVGEAMEENTLAMQACMLTTRPALYYWLPATLELLNAVRRWRQAGLSVYATTDAGAHVAMLCRREDLHALARRVRRLVKSGSIPVTVVTSLPGAAAAVVARG